MLADDGEKFGGWPGTREWVYEKGWLDRFMRTVTGLVDQGEVQLSTLSDALDNVPSGGIAYLPTASYREMEEWSLPADPALRLLRLEQELGPERLAGPDGALIRGAHWRNFMVKYSESNRMHKKMQALSLLCRRRGDPPVARRAIGRAQCNDAYWHGVFGGLYLPHLRAAIWRNLATAEGELRRGEALTAEVMDLDGDGHAEIWVHSDRFSAIVTPRRGGALEEYTVFSEGINYANALTRRREPYHETGLENRPDSATGNEGTPGIHDVDPRAIFVDRVLPESLGIDAYAAGNYWPVRSWAQMSCRFAIEQSLEQIVVLCSFPGSAGALSLEKRYAFAADGGLTVGYRWDPLVVQPDDLFAPELSLFAPLEVRTEPEAEVWTFPIETVAKSERGLDRTRQGDSVTLRWPLHLGQASVEIAPASPANARPAIGRATVSSPS